jgi:hypothetical protein
VQFVQVGQWYPFAQPGSNSPPKPGGPTYSVGVSPHVGGAQDWLFNCCPMPVGGSQHESLSVEFTARSKPEHVPGNEQPFGYSQCLMYEREP